MCYYFVCTQAHQRFYSIRDMRWDQIAVFSELVRTALSDAYQTDEAVEGRAVSAASYHSQHPDVSRFIHQFTPGEIESRTSYAIAISCCRASID